MRNTSGLIPFKKGQSGNPKGRPRKALQEPDFELFRPFTQEAVDRLVEMARGRRTIEGMRGQPKRSEAVPATIQLAALTTIVERGWGKTPQAIFIRAEEQQLETPSNEEAAIDFIRRRLDSIASRLAEGVDPTIIDVQPN